MNNTQNNLTQNKKKINQLNIGKKYLKTAIIIDESLILAIVSRSYSTKPSYIFQLKCELKVLKYKCTNFTSIFTLLGSCTISKFIFCSVFLHVYKFKMSYRIEQNDNDIFFILYMKTSFKGIFGCIFRQSLMKYGGNKSIKENSLRPWVLIPVDNRHSVCKLPN
jgi:hypothetical protein